MSQILGELVFDANLSPALVGRPGAEYPYSVHVQDSGLRSSSDAQIWEHAKTHGFVIVSKDPTSASGASRRLPAEGRVAGRG